MAVATRGRPPTIGAQSKEFQARVLAAQNGDLETYAWAVHNLQFEPYQAAWAEALETEDRVIIVCPPDTYKSTTVRCFVEQQIGLNPNIRILWIMSAGEQSEKNVMTIQQTIEQNEVYKRAFPKVQPDKSLQWTKSVLFVIRDFSSPDPTLMATGLNGPYQGLHFDIIILDDLTNQEDVRSPTTMEYQRNKLRGVIIDRSVEGGRIVGLMTRWGRDDLHDTYKEIGFTIITMPVIGDYPWGPTLSNRKFPLDRIDGIRRDKGEFLFTMTFMCNVEGATGSIINRAHIRYWETSQITRELQLFAGCDPAPSTNPKNDSSSIATVGLDVRTRELFLLGIWADRVEVPDLKSKIVDHSKRTSGLRKFGLETIGFQLGLMQEIRREYKVPMHEIPYRTKENVKQRVLGVDRSKAGRAMYLDSLMTAGRLWIMRDAPLFDGQSLESELCTYGSPGCKRDDRGDAIAFACILAESTVNFQKLKFPVNVRRR